MPFHSVYPYFTFLFPFNGHLIHLQLLSTDPAALSNLIQVMWWYVSEIIFGIITQEAGTLCLKDNFYWLLLDTAKLLSKKTALITLSNHWTEVCFFTSPPTLSSSDFANFWRFTVLSYYCCDLIFFHTLGATWVSPSMNWLFASVARCSSGLWSFGGSGGLYVSCIFYILFLFFACRHNKLCSQFAFY